MNCFYSDDFAANSRPEEVGRRWSGGVERQISRREGCVHDLGKPFRNDFFSDLPHRRQKTDGRIILGEKLIFFFDNDVFGQVFQCFVRNLVGTRVSGLRLT